MIAIREARAIDPAGVPILVSMWHCVATLAFGSLLAGCSIIYNPSNLPGALAEAGPDSPDAEVMFDADPSMLVLTRVTPTVIFEGQGDGSRRAVIAIHGNHIVKSSTTVTIVAHTGAVQQPTLTVHNAELDVAANGNLLAVPITLPVDPTLLAGEQIRLDVTVTQTAPTGPVSFTLSALALDAPVLTLQGLDELTGANATLSSTSPKLYSKVELTGTLRAAAGSTEPLSLYATSTISIAGSTAVNAAGTASGAAGGAGGMGGPGGLVDGSTGLPGGGPAGGQPSGGIGGFTGNDQITTLGNPNRGSGGAGGNGAALGAAGGNGGGGGGTIEIVAGGNLVLGATEAKGADGTTSTNNGGAGSGGVVLLRSGGSVTVAGAGVNVSGGVGPGTAGAAGRFRVDAPGTITATSIPAARYRGPSFATANLANTLIVRTDKPMFGAIAQPNREFGYYFNNDDSSEARGPVTVLTPGNGIANVTLAEALFPGTNELCLIVDGAVTDADTRNCIQIVYLP